MPVPYHELHNIKASLQRLVDDGAEVVQAINDVGGGKLIAIVKDINGNQIGLMRTP